SPKIRGVLVGKLQKDVIELVRRAKTQPTADANVVEDLQQPLHLGRPEGDSPAVPMSVKAGPGFAQQGRALFVFATMFGKRNLEQFLVFRPGVTAKRLIIFGSERVPGQEREKRALFGGRELEVKPAPFSLEKSHSSRSMLACRLYFCS